MDLAISYELMFINGQLKNSEVAVANGQLKRLFRTYRFTVIRNERAELVTQPESQIVRPYPNCVRLRPNDLYQP